MDHPTPGTPRETEQARGLDWFRRTITETPLRVPGTVELTPVPVDHGDDGSFTAHGGGLLLRRSPDPDAFPSPKHLSWLRWEDAGAWTGVLFRNGAVVRDEALAGDIRRRLSLSERAGTVPESILTDLTPVAVTLDLTPVAVPFRNAGTGEFGAMGNDFSLRRDQRKVQGPPLGQTSPGYEVHRWSTPDFDWYLGLGDDVSVDRAGMEELWGQLHPGVPVDRYSRHRSVA